MAKNNKTRFFYVLYSDKTRVFDQSERAYYPIYIIKSNKMFKGNEASSFENYLNYYSYLLLWVKLTTNLLPVLK